MGKIFLIDIEKCNNCLDCLIACNDENFGEKFPDLGLERPELGQYLLRIESNTVGEIPFQKAYYLPKLCMHCENAPCAQVCPVDAFYTREDGLVEVDNEKCIGCRLCIYACPYSTMFYNKELNLAQKCTGCASLLDGGGESPRCVTSCDRKAIIFGDEKKLSYLLPDYEPIIPEPGMKPRIFYKNIPDK